MRKFALAATVFAFFVLPTLASAQQGDAMLGFGTVMSPGASSCNVSGTTGQVTCPERGGLYMNLGADVIFHRRMGFGFDAAWRASRGNYAGLGIPYKPLLFDFNGVYQPKLGKKAGLDLMAGVGWQSTRYYGLVNTFACFQLGQCYQSSNHFLFDLGAGVRYYVWGHVFVRPEARYYKIFNNSADFTSGNIVRVGASIGYTIGPD